MQREWISIVSLQPPSLMSGKSLHPTTAQVRCGPAALRGVAKSPIADIAAAARASKPSMGHPWPPWKELYAAAIVFLAAR